MTVMMISYVTLIYKMYIIRFQVTKLENKCFRKTMIVDIPRIIIIKEMRLMEL